LRHFGLTLGELAELREFHPGLVASKFDIDLDDVVRN